ncbi:MAG: hypothetical protein MR900_01010 [Prevotella sp.]|nr:hypothetical protein [Prevotella sp.]
MPLYKELRTLDEQGRVTATEVYKNDQWTENGLALKEEREFDYTPRSSCTAMPMPRVCLPWPLTAPRRT